MIFTPKISSLLCSVESLVIIAKQVDYTSTPAGREAANVKSHVERQIKTKKYETLYFSKITTISLINVRSFMKNNHIV